MFNQSTPIRPDQTRSDPVSRRHIVRLSAGAGLVPAIVGAHAIQSWLFGVQPIDAVTFAGVTVVLILASAATSWIPAQRATRIEPTAALKAE